MNKANFKVKAFVKHPAAELEIDISNPPDNIATEVQLAGNPDYPDWLPLISRSSEFERSQNPIHAIESIILCQDAGLYPPLSVMNWLVNTLKDWHSQSGKITMDKAMGLNAPGNANPMKNAVREEWQGNLMIELNKLKLMFNLTTWEAASMITSRLDETDWNQSEYKFPYSESTLKQKFESERWSVLFRDINDDLKNSIKNAPDDEKREVLSHYPELSYVEFREKVINYI